MPIGLWERKAEEDQLPQDPNQTERISVVQTLVVHKEV